MNDTLPIAVETAAPAPFHTASAEAPAEARAVWARASDGVKLRLGMLARGPRGTILMLQGRTEYLEKYGKAATEFAARGYGMVAVDFRGQGLSDRFGGNPLIGHVDTFDDYQKDLAALVAFAEREAMPRPWFVLGHSMGGAVGLRALTNGLDVAGAVFSAPLWGVQMHSLLRPVTYGLGWIAHRGNMKWWITPGMSRTVYATEADPDDNLLTHDPEMLCYMRRHLRANPDIALAGASVPWLYRALIECRDLRRHANPTVATLTFLPSREHIVSAEAIRMLTTRWPRSTLIEIPGGAHETMMETPERRALFYTEAAGFFDRQAASAA